MRFFFCKNSKLYYTKINLKTVLKKENEMENLLQVGAILDTHGLRGEVKVFPTTDDASRYDDLNEVELQKKDGSYLHLEVERVRYFKNLVIVKFKNYDNINDIEQYKKCNLYVTREHAVALEENEYFVADLIGLHAYSDEDEDLGTLKDVLTTGANDVYVILAAGGEELLVPAIRDCVKEVNVAEGYIRLHLLDGLRELNSKG